MLEIKYTVKEMKNAFFFFTFFYIYLFLREREREQGWGRERRRHRMRSRLQALSCRHKVQYRAQTHKLWDHDLSQSQMFNWLSHPGDPRILFFFKFIYLFWERQRQRRWGRGKKRGRERIPSRLHTAGTESKAGLELPKLQDHDLSWNQESDA